MADSKRSPSPSESASKRARAENGSVIAAPETAAAARPEAKEPTKAAEQANPEGPAQTESSSDPAPYTRGIAPIKAEYLIKTAASEASDAKDSRDARDENRKNGDSQSKKNRGQNTSRRFGKSRDKVQLCPTRMKSNEFSPLECKFNDKCRFIHDLRAYLAEKRGKMTTFGGICPAFAARGSCAYGWKCRFVDSHSEERETDDGRKELVLLGVTPDGEDDLGLVNVVSTKVRSDLSRRRIGTPKSDQYIGWLADQYKDYKKPGDTPGHEKTESSEKAEIEDQRAAFKDPPFRASEKRRLYYGPDTPILAPLTTQGNLPFRRLCVELGAQVTFSEMALGMPLVQGEKSEWALLRAHETEAVPPSIHSPRGIVLPDYDHSKDFRFGAQIAANKPWIALKTTEVLATQCRYLRTIDLNCGCPIDLIFNQGAGSALLDQPAKLEKILRGMNDLSGEIPISVKIRMGTRDDTPTAQKLVHRLLLGSEESKAAGHDTAGVAAITLHGRSRQQRYSRRANWEYIAETAALVKQYQRERDSLADTVREPDARDLANGGHVYFVGNGDCYSHVDYYSHLADGGVDGVMVARGALVKPWLFEEIAAGQYLDKSGSERLGYVERFVRYGLETWGADEMGIGVTRRFLLEWLSFACRYVPIGLLEHLPPHLNDRPWPYRGRDEMETLMASQNYKDWIKLSEHFLGPAPDDFQFEPKHKSNSYEGEG